MKAETEPRPFLH